MSTYSFLAGLLTGVAVLAAVVWLWRTLAHRLNVRSLPQIGLLAAGGLATFALAAAVLYLTVGRRVTPPPAGPDAQAITPAGAAAPPHPLASGAPGQPAQSMEAATAGLAARLAANGGSDKEWELLAKSYEFMGRAEDAKRARGHQAPAGTTRADVPSLQDALASIAQQDDPSRSAPQGQDPAAVRAELERRLRSNPKDIPTLLDLAMLDQEEHAYAKARERFLAVIAAKGMTADAWADYADVLAALAGGSLAGAAGDAIEQALALNPRNEKALWLKASRAHQEHRYADALALWKTLRAALPAGSPDIAAVESNISESRQLAGGAAGSPITPAAAAPVAVSGTVSIDARLASQVASGSILFIYARVPGAAGPPLAVMRTAAQGWPVSFKLDDSMAMLPGSRLSQAAKVVIEARVSRSGQAAPSPGDLIATSDVIRPADGKNLSLVIRQKIG